MVLVWPLIILGERFSYSFIFCFFLFTGFISVGLTLGWVSVYSARWLHSCVCSEIGYWVNIGQTWSGDTYSPVGLIFSKWRTVESASPILLDCVTLAPRQHTCMKILNWFKALWLGIRLNVFSTSSWIHSDMYFVKFDCQTPIFWFRAALKPEQIKVAWSSIGVRQR